MNISRGAIIILLIFITLIALLIKNGNITGIINKHGGNEDDDDDDYSMKHGNGFNPVLKVTGETSHNRSVAFNNVVKVATYDTYTGKILSIKRYKKSFDSDI